MGNLGQTISKMSEIINKIADFEDKSLLIVEDENHRVAKIAWRNEELNNTKIKVLILR